MRQIDAAGELVGPCAKVLWKTGGWHNRLYNNGRVNLRIVRSTLVCLRRSFARATPRERLQCIL